MLFAVLRATNLCIRGSRVKWRRRVDIEDGTGLPYLPELVSAQLLVFVL